LKKERVDRECLVKAKEAEIEGILRVGEAE
jgi:hypothetical protein